MTAARAAPAAVPLPAPGRRAAAQAKPVRIGYTLSATGPYAVGAGHHAGAELHPVAGPGQRAGRPRGQGRGGGGPIEFVTIDDRSEIETAVRFYEKLADRRQGGPHAAAVGLGHELRHRRRWRASTAIPLIGPTAISGKFKELALPYFYTMLVQPERQMQAVAALLRDLKAQGKVSKVAVAYVNDLFGIELNDRHRARAQGRGPRGGGHQELSARRQGPLARPQGLQGGGRRLPSSGSPIRPTTSWSPRRRRRSTGTRRCSSPRWARRSPSTATASRARRA